MSSSTVVWLPVAGLCAAVRACACGHLDGMGCAHARLEDRSRFSEPHPPMETVMSLSRPSMRLSTLGLIVSLSAAVAAQTAIKPPKNKYTPQQDVELGREAA